MKAALLLTTISLAAPAAGGAIALGINPGSLPQGKPSSVDIMWWTFSGVNAGLAASTALSYRHLGKATLKHRVMATASPIS